MEVVRLIERFGALEKRLEAMLGEEHTFIIPTARKEASFASLRLEVLALLDEMGPKARAILRSLERDKHLSSISEHAVTTVLGAVQSGKAVLIAPIVHTAEKGIGRKSAQRKTPDSFPGGTVFIVHGHDTGTQLMVARFLEKLRLKPLILAEQAAQGQTIIEKLERHSQVDFAVVLLTPDDEGGKVDASERRPRARQNVILELGFFVGKAGRERVAVLFDETVELPSDYHGVEYIPLDAGAGWKLKLARELQAAGLPVDMNRAV